MCRVHTAYVLQAAWPRRPANARLYSGHDCDRIVLPGVHPSKDLIVPSTVLQDPYRVWFFTQTTGTHTGDFNFAGSVIPPTGGKIQNGTEANSVIWTPDRKVKCASAAVAACTSSRSCPCEAFLPHEPPRIWAVLPVLPVLQAGMHLVQLVTAYPACRRCFQAQ